MKTRNGFVSNSSSTSFIVQKNKKGSDDVLISIEISISDLAEHIIFNERDLDEYFTEQYYSTDYKTNKLYINMKNKLSSDTPIYILSTSSDESGLKRELYYQREALEKAINKSKNFTLIDSQQG